MVGAVAGAKTLLKPAQRSDTDQTRTSEIALRDPTKTPAVLRQTYEGGLMAGGVSTGFKQEQAGQIFGVAIKQIPAEVGAIPMNAS